MWQSEVLDGVLWTAESQQIRSKSYLLLLSCPRRRGREGWAGAGWTSDMGMATATNIAVLQDSPGARPGVWL